jgi:hypothetical protein
VLLVETQISEQERQRRLQLTRPDPEWHVQQRQKFLQERNEYAAAFHQSWAQHARGVLALEHGEFDKAKTYFRAAAKLSPKPPPAQKIQ